MPSSSNALTSPRSAPIPSFLRQFTKTYTKEVVCLPFSLNASVFYLPKSNAQLAEAGLIGKIAFSNVWSEDKLRAEISSIFRGVFGLEEHQLFPFSFLSSTKGVNVLELPLVGYSFSWDGKEVASVCSGSCLYIMAGMDLPGQVPRPSYIKHNGMRFYKQLFVKKTTREVVCLRFSQKVDEPVPGPVILSRLAMAGLIGKMSFSTEWSEDQLRAEISAIFRGVFALSKHKLLPFKFLSTIKGRTGLVIPQAHSRVSWGGKEVASICIGTRLYIMAGMKVPSKVPIPDFRQQKGEKFKWQPCIKTYKREVVCLPFSPEESVFAVPTFRAKLIKAGLIEKLYFSNNWSEDKLRAEISAIFRGAFGLAEHQLLPFTFLRKIKGMLKIPEVSSRFSWHGKKVVSVCVGKRLYIMARMEIPAEVRIPSFRQQKGAQLKQQQCIKTYTREVVCLPFSPEESVFDVPTSWTNLMKAGLIERFSFSTNWSEDKLRADISAIFRGAFGLAEHQLLPFTFLRKIRGFDMLTIPEVSSVSWDGNEVFSVSVGTCLYIMAGMEIPSEFPLPYFRRRKGAQLKKQQRIKTYTKEVVCLPFSPEESVFAVPTFRAKLFEAGLIEKFSFSTKWSEDKLRAEISAVFRGAFGLSEHQLLPFTFLRKIKGLNMLTIPEVSSRVSWHGKEVFSVCIGPRLYIIAGMEVPAEEQEGYSSSESEDEDCMEFEPPVPSFPQHNGAQFNKHKCIKTYKREVVCLPFSPETSVFSKPSGAAWFSLAEAGLIGKMSFSIEWSEDQLRAEISAIFRKAFGLAEDQSFPFSFLSIIPHRQKLMISKVSSTFSWDGKEVASIFVGGHLYIMAGMDVPAGIKQEAETDREREAGGKAKEQDSGSQNKVKLRCSQRNKSTEQRVQQQNQPGVKQYQRHRCDECGRSFVESRLFLRHQIRHLEIKPYICEECGMAFHRPCDLVLHSYQHTGIKPHQCEQCGIRFMFKLKLKKHMKTHEELRADPVLLSCSLCGLTFTKKQRLTHHMRIHSRLKKGSCQQCGLIVQNPLKLRKHICHFSETLSRCERCGKAFNSKTLLQLHECLQSECLRSEQTFSSSSALHSPLCVDADMEQESFSESSETRMVGVGLKYLEIRLHRIPT